MVLLPRASGVHRILLLREDDVVLARRTTVRTILWLHPTEHRTSLLHRGEVYVFLPMHLELKLMLICQGQLRLRLHPRHQQTVPN